MFARQAALLMALVFAVTLGVLTVKVMLDNGVDILVASSLLVLALFGFGIVGALLHPPDE